MCRVKVEHLSYDDDDYYDEGDEGKGDEGDDDDDISSCDYWHICICHIQI